jgi:hypothetical protein
MPKPTKPKTKTFTIKQTIYVIFKVKAKDKDSAIDKAHAVINAHSVNINYEPFYDIALTQANFDVEVPDYLNLK